MKRKEINLLPEHARFDINKHFLLKRFFIILIFNVIFLLLISLNLLLEKKFLESKIYEQKIKLKKISTIVENFKVFQEKYSELLKKMNSLNKKKGLYYVTNKTQYSSFLSLLILGKCLTNGIKINTLSYSNGKFILKGNAASSKSFYDFYSILNKNKLVKKVNFYYFEQKGNLDLFDFKISVLLRKIE